ncbi:hypothetical protein NQZ79_g2025 [Umbelopsis isabellina]|nr:hypothetical protein NQZ79_g2025 [Umbelopsis isabellina]
MNPISITPVDMFMSWQDEQLLFQQRSISVYEDLMKQADQEFIPQSSSAPCLLDCGYMPYSSSEAMMNYFPGHDNSGSYLDTPNGNISHYESDDDSIVSPYTYSPQMSTSGDNTAMLSPDVFMPVFDFDPMVLQYSKPFDETSKQSTTTSASNQIPLTRNNLISAQESFLSQQEQTQPPVDSQCTKNKKTTRNNNKNTVTKCPYDGCQRTFQRTHNLRTHMRIHIHPKPYNCSHCERSFSRRHDLERHVRVHTGDRPYSCPCCARSFARTDALRRHLKMEEACRQSPQVQSLKNKRRYADL